jgi:hypothetical protein
MSALAMVLMMIGAGFIGVVFDRTGNYDLAFQVFIGAVAVAVALVAVARRP